LPDSFLEARARATRLAPTACRRPEHHLYLLQQDRCLTVGPSPKFHDDRGILQVADRPDLRPLRAVEPHRLASQAAESAIELARCLRDLPTAEAAFAAYEWLRRPRVEMISGAAAMINQAKAGKAAPGQRHAVTGADVRAGTRAPDRLGRAGRGAARRRARTTRDNVRARIPRYPGPAASPARRQPLGVDPAVPHPACQADAQRLRRVVARVPADRQLTALRLARFFGTSERFWINLQSRYDLEVEKTGSAMPSKASAHSRSPADRQPASAPPRSRGHPPQLGQHALAGRRGQIGDPAAIAQEHRAVGVGRGSRVVGDRRARPGRDLRRPAQVLAGAYTRAFGSGVCVGRRPSLGGGYRGRYDEIRCAAAQLLRI
jgi:hypothetical protein